jgi:hypothetical protein
MPKISLHLTGSLTENKIIDSATTYQGKNLKLLRTEIDIVSQN